MTSLCNTGREVFVSSLYTPGIFRLDFPRDADQTISGGHKFDPETRLMGIALETACQLLRRQGMDNPPREALAIAIIGQAEAVERDSDRLCDAAVAACR